MNIVIVGHVDHGKSTIIGRMLADTDSLPEGKLEQVKENCRRTSRPFEYAFLLDALKDEQSQGITIDSARVFFKTDKRDYIIIDAPGHIEFLKNMISGAARAEAALLVIDAAEGVRENSRRHGYMLAMLGITQVAVLVNKMDLVDYDEKTYRRIVDEYSRFMSEIDITPHCWIPVSGREGDNVASVSARMPWYEEGRTVLGTLDAFEPEEIPANQPFRMPVQDVYKFTGRGDDRRIVAGTVESGALSAGDEVVFYPSGKKTTVKSIEQFNGSTRKSITAGMAAGFTLDEQIYVARGQIAVKSNEPLPSISTRFRASVFWLGRKPFVPRKDYIFKLGTARVVGRLEEITRVLDASTLAAGEKSAIERHDVAECVVKLGKAMAFDTVDVLAPTSRFVIIDDYEITGGGIVREALKDRQAWVRDKVLIRNYRWEASIIPAERRAEKYNQKARLILITGPRSDAKKRLAKELESMLFEDGKIVYYLGIGNVLYGVDADIKGKNNNRSEHIRRLAEVAHILLEAGVLLIVTATDMTQEDLEIIKTAVNPERIETVWFGESITTDIRCDLHLATDGDIEESLRRLKEALQEKGIIFRPW